MFLGLSIFCMLFSAYSLYWFVSYVSLLLVFLAGKQHLIKISDEDRKFLYLAYEKNYVHRYTFCWFLSTLFFFSSAISCLFFI